MKIRGSVVSLRFILPHPPEDKKKKRWLQKSGVKLFRLSFSTGRSSRKCQVFRLDPPVGNIQSKKSNFSTGSPSRKTQSKKPFFDCVRKPDLGFSGKRPFSTDKSDCVRNALSPIIMQSNSSVEKGHFPTGLFLQLLGLLLTCR